MSDNTVLNDELLDLPAGLAPPGHIPDFAARSPAFVSNVVVLTVCVLIATISVSVRWYTSARIIRDWHWEDTLLIPIWCLLLAFSAEVMLAIGNGSGKHMYDVQIRTIMDMLYEVQICIITYTVMVALIKITILLQYLRIFVPQKRPLTALYVVIWTTIVITAIFYSIVMGFSIWICNPRDKFWDPFLPGSCYSWQLIAEVSGIFNVVLDFIVLLIPIAPLRKLQLPRKKKFAIGCVFAAGFLDCLAAILRTYYTWELAESADESFALSNLGIWAWIEIAFGVMIACLPVFPRFIRHTRNHVKFSKSRESGYQSFDLPKHVRWLPNASQGSDRSDRSDARYGVVLIKTDIDILDKTARFDGQERISDLPQ